MKSVEERLKLVPPGLREKVRPKLLKWESLSREEKVRRLREALEYFKRVAEREGGLVAALRFARWVTTIDGAIMLPWMWREEYRALMTEIVYTAVELLVKSLGAARLTA